MSDEHTPMDAAQWLNEHPDGWVSANGLRFLRATGDEVVAELTVGPQHLQAYGIVHGGVYSGVIETLASVGGALWSLPQGRGVVGLENHTSFLRAVREGKLIARARPISRGKTTQVWEATLEDESGRLAASGQVRLLSIDGELPLAGQRVVVDPKMH